MEMEGVGDLVNVMMMVMMVMMMMEMVMMMMVVMVIVSEGPTRDAQERGRSF